MVLPLGRRPRLSLPFTILTAPGKVSLVAGEDFRYTLSAPGLERWLPGLLALLDGRRTITEALMAAGEEPCGAVLDLLERLYGERVLIDGTAAGAHPAARHRLDIEGSGKLLQGLPAPGVDPSGASAILHLLCQDCLDYAGALAWNRRRLEGTSPWMWATCGPLERGYVSPVFLPGAGPCLACLMGQFRRLSPAPEIYDALEEKGLRGEEILAAPFPEEAVAVLQALIRWKARLLSEEHAPAALYRLHVLEIHSLEVTSHRVFADPECPACRERR